MGVTMTAYIPYGSKDRWCKMGKTKDAVLPVPVGARAKMWVEVFVRRWGMICVWIGVGVL